MTIKEKWEAIVDDVAKCNNCDESSMQVLWEDIFADAELFGYSHRKGEIDRQRSIKIGSGMRVIPDIIIKNATQNKDLFVVELKQFGISFRTGDEEQLFSYMRLLELRIGILICNKIYVYYRENSCLKHCIEIDFQKNSTLGENFVELFSKNNFSETEISNFIKINENYKNNVQKIKTEVYELDLKKLVEKYFASRFSDDEIKCAMNDFNFYIKEPMKVMPEVRPVPLGADEKKENFVKLSKNHAIRLLQKSGYVFCGKHTFASKNSTQNNYWANPDVSVLICDWDLILNDLKNRVLMVFRIPAHTFSRAQFKMRNDQPKKIDLQIEYGDPNFSDNRSGIKFRTYLVKELSY